MTHTECVRRATASATGQDALRNSNGYEERLARCTSAGVSQFVHRRPVQDDDRSTRTERADGGLIVDYTADGRAIGIEITEPGQLDLDQLNRVLARLGHPDVPPEDLAPIAAA